MNASLTPTFKLPSAAQGVSDSVKVGELADDSAVVVIKFHEMRREILTTNGVSDAASVDLLVVTGKKGGIREDDRLIFNVGVTNVLENCAPGDVVLGRIEWRTTKSGRQAACLVDPKPGDADLATTALAAPAGKAAIEDGKPAPF